MASRPAPENLPVTTSRRSRLTRRAAVLARRVNLFFWLEIACYVALVAMLVTVWISLGNGLGEGEPVPSWQAAAMLVGTLLPALALIVLWGRRIAISRAGSATARHDSRRQLLGTMDRTISRHATHPAIWGLESLVGSVVPSTVDARTSTVAPRGVRASAR